MDLSILKQAFFLVFATYFVTLIDCANNDKTETNPFHMSWRRDYTRYDFVFSLYGPLTNNSRPISDATHFLTKTISDKCANSSACLLENGTLVELFDFEEQQSSTHRSLFLSQNNTLKKQTDGLNIASTNSYLNSCGKESHITIFHYCSTQWNPPVYLNRYECTHSIEWHSPITCHKNTTNHEQPCYIYNSDGRLIDLTSWILSDGSSYSVDTSMISNSTIKKFHLNICNDAHKSCAPNVASCLVNNQGDLVETGFNNLTSLKYVRRENATHLVTQGQINPHCQDSRIKTTVKFLCKVSSPNPKPKLLKSTPCENIIEWESIHACPMDEIKTSAMNCRIRHNLLNVELDLRKMAANQSSVLVNDIRIDGQLRDMQLGICQGLKDITCEGQNKASTSACLIDKSVSANVKTKVNSKTVGSILKSSIKLTDDRVYLESSAVNKSCSIAEGPHFNITKPLGTRIEFFCASEQAEKPKFLGFDDCVYVFEWGTPIMCLEHALVDYQDTIPEIKNTHSSTTEKPEPKPIPVPKVVSTSDETQHLSPKDKHKMTLDDAKKVSEHSQNDAGVESHEYHNKQPSPADTKTTHSTQTDKQSLVDIKLVEQTKPKMGSFQKVFMIGLIVMSLSAFIVAIFILDKKTRLRVPIAAIRRRAGQAFQPAPVPYSRVDRFNDSLDL